jgi:alkanesulfonate monooxygenase SsuD/methylene tetrahydromethanopterin reductase-like flavin-dependent oxidoreductase (luciferase family)
MGFDAIWTAETQHNPFLPHPLIAEHTRRLQMGTPVAIAFARSPADLAYTAWDLAAVSGGRFILGLGTQVKAHITRRFGMPWPDSVVASSVSKSEPSGPFGILGRPVSPSIFGESTTS